MATRKAAKRAAPRKAPPKRAATKRAATKKGAPRKAATGKAATGKAAPRKASGKKAPATKPAFGRPGTAGKAEGDAAVRAWMQGVKPEHRPLVEKLDALIAEVVPDVKRAIKWSMPMYGREGMGWFASVASFKEHVRLSFFVGTSLTPPPPDGESATMRAINLRGVGDYDETRFRSWIRQAASIQGWGKA